MSEMKTKKGAPKHFTIRLGGMIKRGQAFKRHILTKKITKNKHHLRGTEGVHEANLEPVRAMMSYA